MPAVLVPVARSVHVGPTAMDAAANAEAVELVAAMAPRTLALAPDVAPLMEGFRRRHFERKHGPTSYYGQPSGSRHPDP